MTTDEAWALASAVLRGERKLPRAPPQRLALASALPRVAETLRCLEGAPGEGTAQALTGIWMSLEPEEFEQEGFGTPQLAAGCLEAAELLDVALSPRMKLNRWAVPSLRERPADFDRYRLELARPRVYVPLVNEDPVRVFHTTHPGSPAGEDEAVRDTALLVQRFLGGAIPHWRLERAAPGRSKMAALFVRALLEQFPQTEAVMAGARSSSWGPLTVGITGELDAQGLACAVGELEDKVRRFFLRFPEGRLFVPASQWRQARDCLDKWFPVKKPHSSHEVAQHRARVQPFLSVLELLIRLGVSTPSAPDTALFAQLRHAARHIPCWNTRVREVEQTLALPLSFMSAGGGETQEQPLLEEILERWRLGPSRSAFLEGGPGSGKSIVLRRLNYHLLWTTPLSGPAFRVDARSLIRARLSLEEALHHALGAWMTEPQCRRLVDLASSSALAGSVWLLVDGLDEVPADERRRLREFVARWPGPSLLGSRPLPNEISGAPHVRVQPLDSYLQAKLFDLEERSGHRALLTEDEALPTGDRRKEMVADLCSTPLGISLLAMLPEEDLGARLDVGGVLERCIARLLERAEVAGRLSRHTRMKVLTRGLGVLGSAAWSMIRRGDGTLHSKDLEAMEGPRELQEAVYEVLEGSDFVQRVGPDLYQFSHKSFAEFCAAYFLMGKAGAEEELLTRIGEPGAEAVSFHFGARLRDPRRLTCFLQGLASNRRHPVSSLALATRLLIVSGPEDVELEAALDVFSRRLRVVAHFRTSGRNKSVLPRGLDEDGELWMALARWGPALRPHAEALLDACPADTRRFLRGELPPLRRVYAHYSLRPSDEHVAADIAESLATRLGLEPPLPVLLRFAVGESVLMARPDGPWIRELESLFEAGADEQGVDVGFTAASVWARRAPAERQLEYLEALSRGRPAAVASVLETVRQRGSPAQKREALLRAALNSLELGITDREGDWMASVRFAQRVTDVGSEQWLKQWELLWACGLVGEVSSRAQALEPLYAEFIDDACGPARWRALLALAKLHGSVDEAKLRRLLHDTFRPVRVAAIVQLVHQGAALTVNDVRGSLMSLDGHERWTALNALGAGKTEPAELLLPMLAREGPQPVEPHRSEAWLPEETPWQVSLRQNGEHARQQLIWDVRPRVQASSWPRRLAGMLEGPLADVAEELFPSQDVESALLQELLATGSPRQRRVAAKSVPWDNQELLVAYVDDSDPEIAEGARRAVKRRQVFSGGHHPTDARRAQERARSERERRPTISSQLVAQTESFEELWGLLSTHRLPHDMETQLAYFAEEKQRRMSPDASRHARVEGVAERERKPILRRLRQLYRSHLRPLLLAGLEDEDLEPFSVALMREQLVEHEVLALISRGGRALLSAISILEGTPLGAAGARLLREELLSGGLPEAPIQVEEGFNLVYRLRAAHESFQRGACYWLERLAGVGALLPLLEPAAPEEWRKVAMGHLRFMLLHWDRPPESSPEVLDWARQMADTAQDADLRELAFRLLAFFGDAGDAARWRVLLEERSVPPTLLSPMVRLVARFASESDLPLFRSLLTHSTEVGVEAAVALARIGGASVVEEIARLVEAPPPTLEPQRPWLSIRWSQAAAEVVIRFGDGKQAQRCARAMEGGRGVWHVAATYVRLPEHLLFLADHVGSKDPAADNDNGYDDAKKLLDRMIAQVGDAAAHRVMLEASLWGGIFEQCFRDVVGEDLRPSDVPFLLEQLRGEPEHALVLHCLKQLSADEELIASVWREKDVPWWRPPRESGAPR